MDLKFYQGKKVFITGHTGFKGTWLSKILIDAGAEVTGYSLYPPTEPSLFCLSKIEEKMTSIIGDVRDRNFLIDCVKKTEPGFLIHLAAQPIVRESYRNPVFTYETNVMGTVNILEAARQTETIKSFLNITTDKVYLNREWEWGYREEDPLDGYDPYSNSKSCSELVTHSYQKSFFLDNSAAISTARAGNVIGGGDFAADRIIPDCVRAALKQEKIKVRNPHSIRPYQHVLEPLSVYLTILQKQAEDKKYAGNYNVGPEDKDCVTTGELVDLFCRAWGSGQSWEDCHDGGPHEANFLKLDCSRIKKVFGWIPKWGIKEAVEKTVEWSKVYAENGDIPSCMEAQIQAFFIK